MAIDQSRGSFDPYAILQVAPTADDVVVVAAYRALARRYHPDVAGDRGTADMARLNAAWEIVGDPARRREHDASRTSAPASSTGTSSSQRGGATSPAGRPAASTDGTGAAGPPPGRPSGSVLDFGRHLGWSIGEIARVDPGYLEWLETKPQGRPYQVEIDRTLTRLGLRQPTSSSAGRRQGFFGR